MSKRKNIWDKFKKIEILGSGQFSNVYKVKYNNKYFAIKEINKIKFYEKSEGRKFSKSNRNR